LRKVLTILLLNAIVPCFSIAQDTLLLEDAFVISLENNFDIKLAGYDRSIASNNYRLGNAGFLPEVFLTGSRNYSTQSVNQQFITGDQVERTGAKANNWNATANLDWVLFDGMRMFRAYDRLEQEQQVSIINERIQVENTIQQVILTYYLISIERSSLAVLDSSLRLSKERVDIAKSKYEVGKGTKAEYLSALVDYNTDYSTLIKQQEALQQSKHNLNEILGREITTPIEVVSAIPLDSSLQIGVLRESMITSNRALVRGRNLVTIARLQTREIKGEKLPVLGANAAYSYSKQASEAGFLLSNQVNGLNYGITLRMNIFSGGNINRRIQNARLFEEISETQYAQTELSVIRDLENIYLEYSNNLRLVTLEQENLQVALENAEIALDRYKFGSSSFIELRDAQINGVRAYGRLLSAIYSAKVAETELLRLSGGLVSDLK